MAACCAASISSAEAFDVWMVGEDARASEAAAPSSSSPTSACTTARTRHASGSPSMGSSFLSPHCATARVIASMSIESLPRATLVGSCASSSAWRAASAVRLTSFEPKPPSLASVIVDVPMTPVFSMLAMKAAYSSSLLSLESVAARHDSSCEAYCVSTCCACRSPASIFEKLCDGFGSFGPTSPRKTLTAAATFAFSLAPLFSLPPTAPSAPCRGFCR